MIRVGFLGSDGVFPAVLEVPVTEEVFGGIQQRVYVGFRWVGWTLVSHPRIVRPGEENEMLGGKESKSEIFMSTPFQHFLLWLFFFFVVLCQYKIIV